MSTFRVVVLIVFAAILIVAVLIFSGALPGFRNTGKSAGGTIVWWGTWPQNTMDVLLARFNQDHQNLFTINYVEKTSATLEADLLEAIASGRGPDLVTLPTELLAHQGNKLALLPYQNLPIRDFKNTFTEAGEIYLRPAGTLALPLALDPLVMYYNRDLFSTAGIARPPKTWTEFLIILPPLTKLDSKKNITASALALGSFDNISHPVDILSLLFIQAGNPIVATDDQGRTRSTLYDSFGFPEPPAIAALKFYTQFSDSARGTYTWNSGLPLSQDAFAGGLLATYFGRASELAELRAKNPHLNFDVAIMPQRQLGSVVNYGQVYGLAVLASSKKITPSFQAAFLLTGPDFAKNLVEALGLAPARRDLAAASNPDPFRALFYQAGLATKAWLNPNLVEMTNVFREMVKAVTSGRLTADQAIKETSGALERLLTK